MRSIFVFLHRWVGLAMAAFLILVGVTGGMLAFLPELNHWLTPHLYPGPHAGATLAPAALARRAEILVPQARVARVFLATEGTAVVDFQARPDASDVDFSLYLDPVTGAELGRVERGGLPSRIEKILPFLFKLHWSLALGETGAWMLGVVALAWTIDSFVGFYLTLPARVARSSKSYLDRWKPAWLVKWRGGAYRIDFDLHRAGGLWLWAMLLMFAWSSVCFNMGAVYRGVMGLAFDLETSIWRQPEPPPPPEGARPLDWEEAEARAAKLMSDLAQEQGFHVDRVISFAFVRERGFYAYDIHSSRDVGERYGSTSIYVDAYTGALRGVHLPTGRHSGDTVTTWLVELHTANVFGLPYRILVCVCGLAIVALSVTGVVIWQKKRGARLRAGGRRVTASASAPRPDSRARV